jgi:hypothetical protein
MSAGEDPWAGLLAIQDSANDFYGERLLDPRT